MEEQNKQQSLVAKPNTNSSLNTIFALVNSMLGGTMLTLPLMFRDSGILTSWFVLIISGYISLKTCNIYLKHLAADQQDIQDSIKRIMKGKWYQFFCLITGAYIIMLNVLYMVLINDQLYNLISFFTYHSHHGNLNSLAGKDEFYLGFHKFSQQWLAILTFLPLLSLLFIKNLTFLIRLTAIGVFSVGIFFVYIAYIFFDNIHNIDMSQIKLFSWNLGDLAGTCALAFTIHTVVAPIMKRNQNQSKNERDLVISYGSGALIYSFIGLCGCFAIFNKPLCQKNAETIIDCFPVSSWQPFIVSIVYLFGRITVFPCFMDVSRERLFGAFSKDPIPDKQRNVFNICFMIIAFLFEILSPYIKLSEIMNLTGAVFCFFFVYLIPIGMHLKCYYGEERLGLRSSLITNSQLGQREQKQDKCGHKSSQIDKYHYNIRYAFYGMILVIGIATMVYGVYESSLEFVQTSKN